MSYTFLNMFSRRRSIMVVFVCLSAFLLSGYTGCGRQNNNDVYLFKLAPAQDYSLMGWLDAYDAFHAQITTQYAFTGWKSIDWDTLNSDTRPKIIVAAAAVDKTAYVTALLEYTRSIPDGHVQWGDKVGKVIGPYTNGTYGFGMVGLDDGKVIANIVSAGGEADLAGMAVGDVILTWNGVPIDTVLEQTSTLWRPNPSSIATDELSLLEKYRALVLDPLNTFSDVKFSRSDGSGVTTASLKAIYDSNAILNGTALWTIVDPANLIKYEVLSSGYGYIAVSALDDETVTVAELEAKFHEAMVYLTDRDVPGIIIDLRGNSGGSDELAAKISGYFYSETTVYEYQRIYNVLTGTFDIILPAADEKTIIGKDLPLNIEPQSPQYTTKPVVAIVNSDTLSSAEGVAMTIKNLPQGHVVGLYGSNGSFGMTGGEVEMPEGYKIEFPYGSSHDQYREIQLDSKNGIGGVTPDVRVPKTSANMIKYANRVDIELDYAVAYLKLL